MPMRHAAELLDSLAGPWTDIQDQMGMLFTAACQYQRPNIAEFGVRTGESTRAFLAAAEYMDGHVFSFDVNGPQTPAWWAQSPRWTFQLGDSQQVILPVNIDVLFIDTSHAYEATVVELRNLVRCVRPGGVVLMHDTLIADPPGSEGPMVASDVARALDDFCGETGHKWRERGGYYGLGQIRIPV